MKLISETTTLIAGITSLIGSSLAAPASSVPLAKRQVDIIRPSVTSQYSVWTGAVTYNTARGLVQKTGRTSDITTLVTFDFDPYYTAGRRCRLGFDLAATETATGSRRVDLFTSIKPAETSTTDWPSGNLRDQHLGRILLTPGSPPVCEIGCDRQPEFDCPSGETLAGEIVGVYDEVEIEWDAATSGPYIEVLE